MKIIVLHNRFNNSPIIINPDKISVIQTLEDDGRFTNIVGEYANIVVDGSSFDIKESIRELLLKIKNAERCEDNEER